MKMDEWIKDNKKVIDALQTIVDVCSKYNDDCDKCPFFDLHEHECTIRGIPKNWEIGENIMAFQFDDIKRCKLCGSKPKVDITHPHILGDNTYTIIRCSNPECLCNKMEIVDVYPSWTKLPIKITDYKVVKAWNDAMK